MIMAAMIKLKIRRRPKRIWGETGTGVRCLECFINSTSWKACAVIAWGADTSLPRVEIFSAIGCEKGAIGTVGIMRTSSSHLRAAYQAG